MQVKLEPLRIEHAYSSYLWRNDPLIWNYTFNRPNKKILLEDELKWIEKVTNNNDEKRFAIIAGDVYVGNVYLTDIKLNEAVFQIFIGKREYWGKGIGKEATRLILKYAKEKLQLSEVSLRVKRLNSSAIKLYLKIGFQIIEEFEDYYKMKVILNGPR